TPLHPRCPRRGARGPPRGRRLPRRPHDIGHAATRTRHRHGRGRSALAGAPVGQSEDDGRRDRDVRGRSAARTLLCDGRDRGEHADRTSLPRRPAALVQPRLQHSGSGPRHRGGCDRIRPPRRAGLDRGPRTMGDPMAVVLLTLRDSARVREQTKTAILELADLIDLRDSYTHGHSQRVADLAGRLAKRLRLDYTQVELIRDAARVHDIGKIGTNDLVLQKPGPLTEEEQAEMRRHAEIGHRLLKRLPEFWEGAELVLSHHERHDGTGYPRGLRGDELPLEVSIISVADTYDAMSTDRPYRKGLAWDVVRAELIRQRGKQWRERAVDAFIEMMDQERRPAVRIDRASAA